MISEMQNAEIDLEAIPSNFMCPISLEPMQDPVTLCTGQTYERSSIQRWFDTGHMTCPSTMQNLSDFSLTPNNTLRHLIDSWYFRHGVLYRKEIYGQQQVKHLLYQIRTSQQQSKATALNELNDLLQEIEVLRTFALEEGAFEVLLSLMAPSNPCCVIEAAVAVILRLPLDDPVKRNLATPAGVIVLTDLLYEGRMETRIYAANLMKSLVDLEDLTVRIGSRFEIIAGILGMVEERKDSAAMEAGLSCLLSICSCTKNRLPVVKAGAVVSLVDLLPTANNECVETAMAILDLLCSIADGRSALHDYTHSIPILVNAMRKISENSTHHALSILCTLCSSRLEEAILIKAVKAGAVNNLLLIIQSSCSPGLKQKSVQLLKLLSHNSSSSLYLYSNEVSKTFH
ncbi:hypothetical protein O6H91_23G053800 [Diphasiastrum complanatum]|uniref:Uncharacterized protein n=1 Tax=Diphasiastrum complanatum TaxID=34168 RepID=A0ACC2AC43_DIPCM|nr:hypothetical protein O6H91_23G053800 [Diphasiastrum complanatum]